MKNMFKKYFNRIGNIVWKRDVRHYKTFLPFTNCFKKLSSTNTKAIKSFLYKGKGYSNGEYQYYNVYIHIYITQVKPNISIYKERFLSNLLYVHSSPEPEL